MANMNPNYTLEIAAFSVHGIYEAIRGGANRIEMCENPADGGTTPSYGMLKTMAMETSVPIFPIIRPRGGDFAYSDTEFSIMQEDIRLCKELGYPGVVSGILTQDGEVDALRTSTLVALAAPMVFTFHRAFDRCVRPVYALETIIDCGCHRILSSGQHPGVEQGVHQLAKWVQQAAGRIIIMPGGGLHSGNLKQIASQTKAIEFHTAARVKYRQTNLLSSDTMHEILTFTSVDAQEVEKLRLILNSL
jgi:copper homeostasis protein